MPTKCALDSKRKTTFEFGFSCNRFHVTRAQSSSKTRTNGQRQQVAVTCGKSVFMGIFCARFFFKLFIYLSIRTNNTFYVHTCIIYLNL